MGPMLGHLRGLRFWQVEDLALPVIRRCLWIQNCPTTPASFGIVIDNLIRIGDLPQILSLVSLSSGGLLAGCLPHAVYPPLWLLHPVTRGWLAAVGAVQPQTAFQFNDPRFERDVL